MHYFTSLIQTFSKQIKLIAEPPSNTTIQGRRRHLHLFRIIDTSWLKLDTSTIADIPSQIKTTSITVNKLYQKSSFQLFCVLKSLFHYPSINDDSGDDYDGKLYAAAFPRYNFFSSCPQQIISSN
jgi:hypothetical protein